MLFGRFVPWQSRPGEGFDRRIGHAWLSSGWKSSKKNASCCDYIISWKINYQLHKIINKIPQENKKRKTEMKPR